jgi:hypothetical protein
MIDEQVAILEHRLMSKQVPPASSLLDHKIDDIDIIIRNQQDAIEQDASNNRSSYQFDKMNQFKNDIIQQTIIISCQMGENFVKIVRDEQQIHSFNRNDDESQSDKQVSAINAIETRRLHMIKWAKYITQQKLPTYFKQN